MISKGPSNPNPSVASCKSFLCLCWPLGSGWLRAHGWMFRLPVGLTQARKPRWPGQGHACVGLPRWCKPGSLGRAHPVWAVLQSPSTVLGLQKHPGLQKDSGPGRATAHLRQGLLRWGNLSSWETWPSHGSIPDPDLSWWGRRGYVLAQAASNKTWLVEQEGKHGDHPLFFIKNRFGKFLQGHRKAPLARGAS